MKWSEVIVHHSASADGEHVDTDEIRRFHVESNGWRDIGYHFVVELVEGQYLAIAARPLYMVGAHCPGHNSTAIGVCLVGNFVEHGPPQEQVDCAARLIAGLCRILEIPVARIRPHSTFRNTECPGLAGYAVAVAVEKLL